jgi:outer membrane receptor protein involved in Fe transport
MYEGSEHKPFSFIQATLNKSLGKSSVSLQGWFQYFDNLDDYGQSRFEQNNKQYGLEAKYDFSVLEHQDITVGSSFRYNDGSSTKNNFKNGDPELIAFPRYATRLYSLYTQDKWKILKNLEATLGIRYDHHSVYGGFYSPRAGINYLFSEYFNTKLLYGRALRTPSLAVILENSGLDPERIDSYEAELGYHYKNIFGAEINFFYNELKNLIERDATGSVSNTGDENIKGFELSVTGRPYPSLSLYANYTHLFGNRQRGRRSILEIPGEDPNQPVETTIESFVNVAPNNVANFGIDYSFLRHFRTTLELNYVGERRLVQGLQSVIGDSTKLGSYVLCDANFFVKDLPFKNLDIALKLKNITGKQYKTRGVFGLVDGQGRATYIIFTYKF